MTNTRIKPVPGLEGLNSEAIASNLIFEYDAVAPGESRVTFAYRDYIVDAEGKPTAFTAGSYDTMSFLLKDVMHWDLGGGHTPQTVLDLLRVATDVAHNERYGNAGGST